MNAKSTYFLLLLISCMNIFAGGKAYSLPENPSEQIRIPIAGNAYLTAGGDGDQISSEGITEWQSPNSLFSIYFKLEDPSQALLQLELGSQDHDSKIEVRVGQQKKTVKIPKGGKRVIDVGKFRFSAGYNQVSLKGVAKEGAGYAQVKALLLHIPEEGLVANYVRDNIDNRFYWGRRGPSVHLSYELPRGKDFKWFYSEITVPKGEDPNGSYFMANGFAEGYFGIQANSDKERRVLFSVWSPFATDNPEDIPENQRIKLLKKGKEVYSGKFGNEGSGGQSFLRFNWKAGTTYGFLNAVEPDGKGNTVYTAYFYAPEIGKWQLIASFLRPQTNTWYQRPHSFLENFNDRNGYKGRMAYYTNQWARNTQGEWIALTKAKFTADDIGRRGYRKDFAGGLKEEKFYLRNGGFFNESTKLNSQFIRSGNKKSPDINFEELE